MSGLFWNGIPSCWFHPKEVDIFLKQWAEAGFVAWIICSQFPLSVSQLEIDNGDEVTSDFLYEEVHPKQHAHKQAFAKPRGPAGKRGYRRITRPPAEGEEED